MTFVNRVLFARFARDEDDIVPRSLGVKVFGVVKLQKQ